jgi:hypothetical protein
MFLAMWQLGPIECREMVCAGWWCGLPSLKTRIRSLSITVWILCATVSTVQSPNSSRSVCWIIASVDESTEAVASSRTRTLLRFSRTLPRQNNCLCPTLQFSPFSTTAREISFDHLNGEIHTVLANVAYDFSCTHEQCYYLLSPASLGFDELCHQAGIYPMSGQKKCVLLNK